MKKMFNLVMAYVYQYKFLEARKVREAFGKSWGDAYSLVNDYPNNQTMRDYEELREYEEICWKNYEEAQEVTDKYFNTWAYYLHCSY